MSPVASIPQRIRRPAEARSLGQVLTPDQATFILDRLTDLPSSVRHDLERDCERMLDHGDNASAAWLIDLLDRVDSLTEDLEPDDTDCGNAEDDCTSADLRRFPFSVF